jgi:DNA-binding NtrC family response regulator
MPFTIQSKILRLLEEKSIERLGGREPIPVDVRIIAATNRNLETALAEGRFREDLYYRLKVVTLWLPPLRERPGDIPLLAEYLTAKFASDMGMDNPGITGDALALLNSCPWQGNVRELANALQKALIYNRGVPINNETVSRAISGRSSTGLVSEGVEQPLRQWIREGLLSENRENLFDTYMDLFAAILVSEALTLTQGNRSQSARLLGLSRPTLHSKIEKYGLKFETSVKKG